MNHFPFNQTTHQLHAATAASESNWDMILNLSSITGSHRNRAAGSELTKWETNEMLRAASGEV